MKQRHAYQDDVPVVVGMTIILVALMFLGFALA